MVLFIPMQYKELVQEAPMLKKLLMGQKAGKNFQENSEEQVSGKTFY